jgi:hypothetical protein
LQQYKENDTIQNEEILDLLQYHPTKHINKNNIEFVVLRKRKPYNTLALFYKYKTSEKVDDVSYVLCIQNIFGKYNRDSQYVADVLTAFRNESHIGTKKQYFLKNTTNSNGVFIGTCCHCNHSTNSITTDHHIVPFKQIFDSFIKEHNIVLSDVDIFENDDNELRLTDTVLASKWLAYHDKDAKYRLLCKSCNSHFGSYGYMQ